MQNQKRLYRLRLICLFQLSLTEIALSIKYQRDLSPSVEGPADHRVPTRQDVALQPWPREGRAFPSARALRSWHGGRLPKPCGNFVPLGGTVSTVTAHVEYCSSSPCPRRTRTRCSTSPPAAEPRHCIGHWARKQQSSTWSTSHRAREQRWSASRGSARPCAGGTKD
jgi:hypothetical protein